MKIERTYFNKVGSTKVSFGNKMGMAASPALKKLQSAANNAQTDKIQISKEMKEEIKRQEKLDEEQKKMEQQKNIFDNALKDMQERMKQAEEQSKRDAEMMEIYRKCLLISSRIMQGDKVPMRDEKFLMEHNIDMYSQAVNMRSLNEANRKKKPKEWDSVLGDEDGSQEISEEIQEILSEAGVDMSQYCSATSSGSSAETSSGS